MSHANESTTGRAIDCHLHMSAAGDDYEAFDGYKGLIVHTAPMAVQTDPLLVCSPTEEVLRICHNGDVLWRSRLVESDDDFKKAMLDMASVLKDIYTKGNSL